MSNTYGIDPQTGNKTLAAVGTPLLGSPGPSDLLSGGREPSPFSFASVCALPSTSQGPSRLRLGSCLAHLRGWTLCVGRFIHRCG